MMTVTRRELRSESGAARLPRGRRGRAARLASASAFTGVMPIIGLVNPSAKPLPEALWWLFVCLLALTAWLWLRFPLTGPRIVGDFFVVNSWFSRRVFHREKLQRFRAEEYEGIIFFFAWTIPGGSLRSGELEVELSDGTVTRLKGTMCNYREARRMAEAANRWLGIEVGAGTGPRRSLRARRNS